MIKLILYVIIPLLALAGTVVACLALTGNLSKEQMLKIIGKGPAAEQSAEAPKEEDPYLRALQQREEALKKREAKLQEGEAQLKKSQADLEQLKTEIEAVQKEIGDTLKSEDADAQKRISDVALSLSKMKPTSAAKTLESWEIPDAAKVLRGVKDKERGKILDAMPPEKAAAILLELKAAKI